MSPNPVDTPELYDYVTLAGKRSPGIAKCTGFARGQKWDIKDGDGQDGATTTLKGTKIAQGTITLFLWKDQENDVDHFADYDVWRDVFAGSVGNKSRGLDLYYPDTARLKIKSISIEEEGILKHDGKGGATVDIKVLEFKPPKPKPAETPIASKTKPGPDPDQDLIDKINSIGQTGLTAAKERGGKSVFFQ